MVVLKFWCGFLLWFVDIAPSYDGSDDTFQTERLDLTSDTTLKKSEVLLLRSRVTMPAFESMPIRIGVDSKGPRICPR